MDSVFGSQRLTGALLDRRTQHVHILELNGEGYRLKQSKARRRRAAQLADEEAAADPETGGNHHRFLKAASCSTPTPQTGLVLLRPIRWILLQLGKGAWRVNVNRPWAVVVSAHMSSTTKKLIVVS